ncbi:MAG: hypothetical protein DCF16_19170 [Alphaproteobacteria bacterium]|nr:MAG: hypothetical protein DCF16_19170 [Alphaproteobacteria bacterium]
MRGIVLGVLVAALMALMWLVLPNIYEGAANAPNEATGEVWALNNHGRIVYVTQLEKLIQSVLTPALFIVTLVVGALAFVRRKQREDRSEN